MAEELLAVTRCGAVLRITYVTYFCGPSAPTPCPSCGDAISVTSSRITRLQEETSVLTPTLIQTLEIMSDATYALDVRRTARLAAAAMWPRRTDGVPLESVEVERENGTVSWTKEEVLGASGMPDLGEEVTR